MELYHAWTEKKSKSGLDLSVDFTELEEMASIGLLSLSVQLRVKALKIMREDEVTSHAG
ncbi:MAG: hypothetical protein N2645_19090 [Clostridia bacterium]|nr:hypothetical protein [Clostridia bacterium]